MNLEQLHKSSKNVSATSLFKGSIGSSTAIQLQKEAVLKEHITPTPALLLCISGELRYEDENGQVTELKAGDYLNIPINVKHWLQASSLSQLLLLK